MIHMLYKCCASLIEDRRGTSLVEFTLLLPFLTLLMLGVAEYGRAMHQQHIIAKSVRDAARTLARDPRLFDPAIGCSTTIPAALKTQTETIALKGTLDVTASYLIAYWNNPLTEVTISISCIPPAGLDSPVGLNPATAVMHDIPVVTVRGVVPFDDIGLFSIFGMTAPTLRTEHVQMGVGL